jgi:hypothetical protein
MAERLGFAFLDSTGQDKKDVMGGLGAEGHRVTG